MLFSFFVEINIGLEQRKQELLGEGYSFGVINQNDAMTNLKIALDWTPNINHIGIFVAQQLNYYKESNIEVEIINPLDDNYELTPGKKLELDIADFAIAPFETVISLNNKENEVDAMAVYAILQEDISSIASLKSSKIERSRELDGKKYASYKARYEDQIVMQMVKNDGGEGKLDITYPAKLGIWETLLAGNADATWIFDNWEGVEAEAKQVSLNKFSMGDYGIPYCYSPVILAKKSRIRKQKNEFASFIKATQRGYLFAATNKSEAIEILSQYLTTYDNANIDLKRSIELTAPVFGTAETCGYMKPKRIEDFLTWLVEHELENEKILKQDLFSNELLA